MACLPVFLDTSFLRGVGRDSIAARVLKRLVDNGKVVLHVPALVEQEWATQRGADFVREWLDDRAAIRHALGSTDAHEVFSLYFAGLPPFRSPKNRADIPDGFIFVRIRAVSAQMECSCGSLIGDRTLRAACASLPNMTVWATLPMLVGHIDPFLSAKEIRNACQLRYRELVDAIETRLPLKVLEEATFWLGGFNLEISELGDLESISPGSFDWVDSDPLDTNIISIPFGVSFPNSRVRTSPSESEASALTTAEIRVEAWLDVEVEWAGNGKISRIDLRLDRVVADTPVVTPPMGSMTSTKHLAE